MLIDWFTVGAQALNFVILVWLLKRFLYRPILDAIDARERGIARQLADADATKIEAHRERAEFLKKSDEFDAQRASLLAKALGDAQAERERLLGDAREAADSLSNQRRESLRDASRKLHQALAQRTQQEVFAIARKTLADLGGVDLEQRFAQVLIQKVRALRGDEQEALAKALKTAAQPPIVRSAFELSPTVQSEIRAAINATFGADIPLRFQAAPELVGGIELATDGDKVAWSIAAYLASLEQGIGELLRDRSKGSEQLVAAQEAKSS